MSAASSRWQWGSVAEPVRLEQVVHPRLPQRAGQDLFADALLVRAGSGCCFDKAIRIRGAEDNQAVLIAHNDVTLLHHLTVDADGDIDAAWSRLVGASVRHIPRIAREVGLEE